MQGDENEPDFRAEGGAEGEKGLQSNWTFICSAEAESAGSGEAGEEGCHGRTGPGRCLRNNNSAGLTGVQNSPSMAFNPYRKHTSALSSVARDRPLHLRCVLLGRVGFPAQIEKMRSERQKDRQQRLKQAGHASIRCMLFVLSCVVLAAFAALRAVTGKRQGQGQCRKLCGSACCAWCAASGQAICR